MSTLLLRLAAPLQAWGVASKFERRDTLREPTKSAVVGLVAAALGYRRDDSRIRELGQALRFGVRVDREGSLLHDYHTARNLKHAYVTDRYYLCDAVFLAGLEGQHQLLEEIEQALAYPVFPLFLGRRACPPEGRLCLGIRQGVSLWDALESEPPLCHNPADAVRFQIEAVDDNPNAYLLRDQPISFDQQLRQHGFRRVAEGYQVRSGASPDGPLHAETHHDALQGLEE